MINKKEYALYKGEKLLIIGTIEEIAKNQNITEKSVMYYGTPAHLRKNKNSHPGNYKVLVKLD